MQDIYVLEPENTVDNRDISEITADKNKKESIGVAEAIVLNKAEKRYLNITSELIRYTVLLPFVPADIALITPVK
jgi:hypothetical protein